MVYRIRTDAPDPEEDRCTSDFALADTYSRATASLGDLQREQLPVRGVSGGSLPGVYNLSFARRLLQKHSGRPLLPKRPPDRTVDD